MKLRWIIAAAVSFGALASEAVARTREALRPPPSSSEPLNDVLQDAQAWVNADPASRVFSPVAATGSMLPLFGSNAILCLEKVTASDLLPGDIAVYVNTARKLNIVHRVREVRSNGVLFDGDNNKGSDGWVSPAAVNYRVARIYYAQRKPAP